MAKLRGFMDVKTLQNEVRKLSVIVGSWSTPEDITEVERDIVLEKLRALYEAVRFAEVTTGEPAMMEIPAGIDFELSPVPLEDILADERAAETPGNPVEEEASAAIVAEPEDTASGPVAEVEPEFDAQEVAPASETQADEVVVEVQPVSESPVSECMAEPVSESAPAPAPAPESESESESEPKTAPVSEPVIPTLFGLEDDDALRHRRKQRVIMALYNNDSERDAVSESVPELLGDNVAVADENFPEVPSQAAAEDAGTSSEEQHAAVAGYAAEPADEDPFGEEAFEEITIAPADTSKHEEQTQTAAPGTVLGEVMNHGVQTLADTIAPRRDVASELRRGEPVGDLRRAIGLNDRFLLVRDLFDGDADACDAVLESLNGFNDLDDCMIYIAENYAWNPNSDGAKFLMELLERKFE